MTFLDVSAANLPRAAVVRALMGRHLRTVWRSRMLIWLGVLAFVVWLQGPDDPKSSARILAGAEIIGALAALFVGAGILAREYDTGGMILDRLHGARASELVVAAVVHVFTAALLFALFYCAMSLLRGSEWLDARFAGGAAIVALELFAWTSFLTLLGALVPSYGNSVLAFALVMIDASASMVADPPELLGAVFSAVHWGVPIPGRLSDAVDTAHSAAGISAAALIPATVWIPLGVVLAVIALDRTEPASRWRR